MVDANSVIRSTAPQTSLFYLVYFLIFALKTEEYWINLKVMKTNVFFTVIGENSISWVILHKGT
jgi:hypothetical protein